MLYSTTLFKPVMTNIAASCAFFAVYDDHAFGVNEFIALGIQTGSI